MSARRPGRSRVWAAVGAALIGMAVAGVGLLALELWHVSASSAPTVHVADRSGPTGPATLAVPVDDLAARPTHDVTVRVRNDAPHPVDVLVAVSAGQVPHTATLTATLTEQGAVVRSGPLSALDLPVFTMPPLSVTPVTVQLTEGQDLDDLWGTGLELVFTVTAAR